MKLLNVSNSGLQEEIGPRLLDQGPSHRSEPSPTQGRRLGGLGMSHPTPLTAPAGRGVTMVAICELDSSSYCFLLINCLDVKKQKKRKKIQARFYWGSCAGYKREQKQAIDALVCSLSGRQVGRDHGQGLTQ